MRWRLIHSGVEPDSVSATMALAPRWWAVKECAHGNGLINEIEKVLPVKSAVQLPR